MVNSEERQKHKKQKKIQHFGESQMSWPMMGILEIIAIEKLRRILLLCDCILLMLIICNYFSRIEVRMKYRVVLHPKWLLNDFVWRTFAVMLLMVCSTHTCTIVTMLTAIFQTDLCCLLKGSEQIPLTQMQQHDDVIESFSNCIG